MTLIGQRLGQYEILSLLGEGGMAAVYRARQLNIKRDVAIKVMDERLARQSDFARRFEREAETIADLNHAHTLKLFDYGQQGDQVYLVMELLRGGSLSSLIRQGPLAPERVGQILDQVASALDYAHGRGVIHRDLKPPNVLFDDAGNAFLTDFGIAKILSETTALTQSGTVMGTPAYMAPEQWRRGAVDSRADLYALGIMLFEMLTGHVPFEADTPYQMMFAHIQEPPPPIRSLRPDLPPALEAVIQKALAKDPERRFQSAGEMASAFRLALAGQIPTGLEVDAEPEGPRTAPQIVPPTSSLASAPLALHAPRAGRRNGLLALGAAGLALLLGLGAVLLGVRGKNSAPSPTRPDATSTIPALVLLPTNTLPPTATRTLTLAPTRSDEELALATVHAIVTLTATSFTRTPTNAAPPTMDQPGTLAALQTQILARTQTAAATGTAMAVASFTKTLTPTPSLTSTSIPIPTFAVTVALPLISASISPTASPTQELQSTKTAESNSALVKLSSANLRSGPGIDYSQVGVIMQNTQLNIIAYTRRSAEIWYLVNVPGSARGWISGDVVTVLNAQATVPVAVTVPATPRPPTATQVRSGGAAFSISVAGPYGTFKCSGIGGCLRILLSIKFPNDARQLTNPAAPVFRVNGYWYSGTKLITFYTSTIENEQVVFGGTGTFILYFDYDFTPTYPHYCAPGTKINSLRVTIGTPDGSSVFYSQKLPFDLTCTNS